MAALVNTVMGFHVPLKTETFLDELLYNDFVPLH
jgi:hypothetical protein